MGNPRNIRLAIAALVASHSVAAAGDAAQAVRGQSPPGISSLNAEQLRAAGISVAHPLVASTSARTAALGVVLDATDLDIGGRRGVRRGRRRASASAEVVRLRALVRAAAPARRSRCSKRRRPSRQERRPRRETARGALRPALGSDRCAAGECAPETHRGVAERPQPAAARRSAGRHSAGRDSRAMRCWMWTALQVPGRVLGALRQTGELQSAALLIEVHECTVRARAGRPRAGRLADGRARKGLLLPRDAVLYDENGAYVLQAS